MQAATATPADYARRQHPRVRPDNGKPVIIDLNGEDFIDILHARDISEGGVGILVPHQFAQCRVDEEVRLMITLPAPVNATVKATGKIRHKSGDAFGVRFTQVSNGDRAKIRQYVRSRLPEEPLSYPDGDDAAGLLQRFRLRLFG